MLAIRSGCAVDVGSIDLRFNPIELPQEGLLHDLDKLGLIPFRDKKAVMHRQTHDPVAPMAEAVLVRWLTEGGIQG